MNLREGHQKKYFAIIFNIMLIATILLGTFVLPVQAAGTTVKVNPVSMTVAAGNTFTISIVCVPSQAIKAFELQISYNPTYLKANSVSKGTIFQSYSTFFNAGTIDNTKGTITNIYDIILGTGSTSTSGTLVTISFTAKTTTGTSAISLKNAGVLNNVGYLSVTRTNGSVQITQSQPSNDPVVYDYMSPINKSTNIPLTTKSISISMKDPEGKPFDYTIQTYPNVGRVSIQDSTNGTKSCTLSGLKYATTYKWYVNTTDGVNSKCRWYLFSTIQDSSSTSFTYSAQNPADAATDIPISTSKISIMVQNTQGHNFDMTIRTSPDVGSNTRSSAVNGVKSFTLSRSLTYSTTYRWYVSCRDVTNGQWTNQSYWFKTEPDPDAVNNPPSGGGGGGDTSTPDSEPGTPEPISIPDAPVQPDGPTLIIPGMNFYYSSLVASSENVSYRLQFNWGDGTCSNWTEPIHTNVMISLSHSWTNASSYNITVIAQDENGTNSSISQPLTILVSNNVTQEQPSVTNISTSPSDIYTNQIIQFAPSNSTLTNESISSYYWEFGDGKTATARKANNVYTTPGQYMVNLTITDTSGNIYTERKIITVESSASILAQNKADLLPFVLLTSSTIGIIIVFVVFFILFSREVLHIPLKKYVLTMAKSIQYLMKRTVEIIHSILFKPKSKKEKSTVHENKKIETLLHLSVSSDYTQKNVDDDELAYIHYKIDQLIMDS